METLSIILYNLAVSLCYAACGSGYKCRGRRGIFHWNWNEILKCNFMILKAAVFTSELHLYENVQIWSCDGLLQAATHTVHANTIFGLQVLVTCLCCRVCVRQSSDTLYGLAPNWRAAFQSTAPEVPTRPHWKTLHKKKYDFQWSLVYDLCLSRAGLFMPGVPSVPCFLLPSPLFSSVTSSKDSLLPLASNPVPNSPSPNIENTRCPQQVASYAYGSKIHSSIKSN